MTSFSLQHKTVHVYGQRTTQACPIIYFHAFEEISEPLLQQLSAAHCPQATLVIISDLDWNRDMVPWDIPQSDDTFHGGADAYLRLLTSPASSPQQRSALSARPLWRGIAGYSLAGLFALYALYQSDAFSPRRQHIRLPVVSRHQRILPVPRTEAHTGPSVFLIGPQRA